MTESLPQLEDFQREEIINSNGMSFKEYRKTLKPKYWRVWVDIAIGYVMLIIGIVCAIVVKPDGQYTQWIAIVALPIYFGYFHHYVTLFFHEATHFNIAKSRKLNDILANIFIGSLMGQNIKNYRPIHLIHHRQLGTSEDSEVSYFEALSFRFILESLTGIRAVKILLSRKKRMVTMSGKRGKSFNLSLPDYQILVGASLHFFIFCLALIFQSWILLLTWFSGLFLLFPFFGSIRQLMEHRDEKAPSNRDFTKFPHGKVNRMFGTGPVASTFGGAGFNRHLLHHWEPQISYTNLAEVERFLYDSNVAPVLAHHQTSYFRTFFQLLSWK